MECRQCGVYSVHHVVIAEYVPHLQLTRMHSTCYAMLAVHNTACCIYMHMYCNRWIFFYVTKCIAPASAVSSASTLHGRGPVVGGNPANPPSKANLSKNQKKRLKKKLKKQQQKEEVRVRDRDKEDSDRTEDVPDGGKEEKEADKDELPAAMGEGRMNGCTAGSTSGSSMDTYSTPVSTEGQPTAQKMTADKQRDGTGTWHWPHSLLLDTVACVKLCISFVQNVFQCM